MMKSNWLGATFAALVVCCGAANAQLDNLQFTEVLFNSSYDTDEGKFEWVEVRNTGATPIDLDGYMFRDYGNSVGANALPIPANIVNVNSGGATLNTVVPANSTAILYSGYDFGYDDDRFRAGWGLDSSTAIIAVDFFPGLNNSGTERQIGLWATVADWEADAPLVDTTDPADGVDDARIVNSFANAALHLDYTTAAGFPTGENGKSITWTGSGDIANGANWVISESGINGAYSSTETYQPSGSQRNGVDFANPNWVPAGTAASGLLITEVMVDPGEPEGAAGGSGNNDFEWFEVYNNTGATIDFGVTPYVFDDDDNADLTEANITSGSIAQGEIAVLFDDGTVTIDDMVAMWGNGNYIPVSSWTSLSNGGDAIAIWSSLSDYTSEPTTGVGRTFENALASLTLSDSADNWPDLGAGSSVYLTDLSAALGNNTSLSVADGALWARAADDFSGNSVEALPLYSDTVVDYVGGEVGSPGYFAVVENVPLAGDFNGDGEVDIADYVVWRNNLGSTDESVINNAGVVDGVVDASDYYEWKSNFGATAALESLGATAVPEPTSVALVLLGVGLLGMRRFR